MDHECMMPVLEGSCERCRWPGRKPPGTLPCRRSGALAKVSGDALRGHASVGIRGRCLALDRRRLLVGAATTDRRTRSREGRSGQRLVTGLTDPLVNSTLMSGGGG